MAGRGIDPAARVGHFSTDDALDLTGIGDGVAHILLVRQAQMLLRGHIAEHRGAIPADVGRADAGGNVIIGRRDVGDQRPKGVERGLEIAVSMSALFVGPKEQIPVDTGLPTDGAQCRCLEPKMVGDRRSRRGGGSGDCRLGDERVQYRVFRFQCVGAEGLYVEPQRRLHVAQCLVEAGTLADNHVSDADRVCDIAVGVPFDDDLDLLQS